MGDTAMRLARLLDVPSPRSSQSLTTADGHDSMDDLAMTVGIPRGPNQLAPSTLDDTSYKVFNDLQRASYTDDDMSLLDTGNNIGVILGMPWLASLEHATRNFTTIVAVHRQHPRRPLQHIQQVQRHGESTTICSTVRWDPLLKLLQLASTPRHHRHW